ncbi:MAG: hypothetical protein ACQESJ_11020 [Bacteroidota bacterium]
MDQKLPNTNKKQSFYVFRNLVIVSTILFLGFYLKTNNIELIYFYVGILVFFLILGYYSFKKHNIESVILKNDSLIVIYRTGKIVIPLQQIEKIITGMGTVMFSKRGITIETKIILKQKYKFGKKLFFSFDFEEGYLINPDKYPRTIYQVKKRLIEIRKNNAG